LAFERSTIGIMLAVIVCLAGVFALLAIAEYMARQKWLKGENLRQFVHITVGSFVAFWPWLIGWSTIQIHGTAMLAVVILNRSRRGRFFHFNKVTKRETYGDIFFALAIIACALLTTDKIFFALAILNLSLADGLAAVVGLNFGKRWRYKVYYHTKTVLGSMAFWLVSICVLGVGLLFAHNVIDFTHYALLVVFLPPLLTALENVCMLGLDDLVIPLAVLLFLRLAQMG
jgi:dolichol kinase